MAGKAKDNMRPQGEEWFRVNRPELADEVICVSKFHKTREGWWIDVPEWRVATATHINLLCEIGEGTGQHFYHLRVRCTYFVENRDLLDYREYGGKTHSGEYKYSLHLSPNADNRFRELRGDGRLDFSEFLYSPDGGKN